jgi:hypothetical protein
MQLSDLGKDIRRLLLEHWTKQEIEDRLSDPDYFFEQVVIPRLDFLRRSGADVPILRVGKTANGEMRVFLN